VGQLRLRTRHAPFALAALGGIAVLFSKYWLNWQLVTVAAANTFFFLYLILTALRIPQLTPSYLKKHAAGADEPEWVILAVTSGAVVVAVGSLFVLINSHGGPDALTLVFSLASVALGWLTVHTMAAMHYAHRYWRPDDAAERVQMHLREPHGGLDFPGPNEPAGYDFLYFAFIIGMTAQTSDVAVTTTAMRKMSLLHGVFSFFFNTVLVAAAVNLVVSLGS
jgi:uncharacterized membrane protein